MKRTRKRILCICAAAALTFCSLPQDMSLLRPAITAYAETTVTQDGITYIVSADHAAVTGCNSAIQEAVIAEKISGQPVTAIIDRAFSAKVNLTAVTLPDSVRTIGKAAFQKCSSLTEIDLKKVTEIDEYAFASSGLTKISLPDSVTSVGNNAFYQCQSLQSVSIGSSLKTIGAFVFCRDPLLNSFTVSADNKQCNVTDGALYLSSRLIAIPANTTEFTVPNGTTNIRGAFTEHPNLKKVIVRSSSILDTEYAFAKCNKLEEIQFRGNFFRLHFAACLKCPALKKVTLPEGLYEIEESVFMNDAALETITIPASVKIVNAKVFGGCKNLGKITFLNPVCEISSNLFQQSSSDTPVPFTGTIAGYDGSTAEAFAANNGYPFESLGASFDPSALKEGEYGTDVIDNVTYHVYKDHAEVAGCADLITALKPRPEVFGIRVTKIADNAFRNNKTLLSIELPDSITEIGYSAFMFSNIKTVKCNSGCKTIAAYAFSQARSLTNLTLPDTLETIGWSAFEECFDLTEINLPASVTTLNAPFYECKNLKKILVAPESKSFVSVNGILYTKDMTELICLPSKWSDTAFTFTLPDSVTKIRCHAVNQVAQMTSFVCSENSQLKVIEGEAFWNSNAMKSIVLPDTLETIESCGLSGCGLESVQIPEGVTVLNRCALQNCIYLQEAIIPEQVKLIDEYTFFCDEQIKTIVILNPECEISDILFCSTGDPYTGKIYGWKGSTAEKYCEKYGYTFVDLETVDNLTYDGIIYKIENHTAVVTGHTDGIKTANIRKKVFGIPVTKIADNAFLDCTTLTSLTMPEGITEIGDMAFRECEALTGVIRIPDSVVKIGLNAFQRCAKVKEFDFGLSAEPNTNPNAQLKEIGIGAFEYCYALEQVILPESTRIIGGSAFHMCTKLTVANCGRYVAEIDNLAFADCSNLLYCGVGYDVRNIGEGAFRSCKMLDLVYIPDSAETIGKYAFSDCGNMQDIYIYSKDVKITDAADTICSTSSPAVKFAGTIHGYSNSTAQAYAKKYGYAFKLLDDETAEEVARDGIIYKFYEDHAEVIGCEKTVTTAYILQKIKGLPVTAIAANAFAGDHTEAVISSVYIPSSVKTIGKLAFAYQKEMKTVTLSEGTESIGENAFMQTGLTEFTIPDSVKEIGDSALEYNNALRSIRIGAGTEKIGKAVFAYDPALEQITVSSGSKSFKCKDGMLYSADETRIVAAPCTVTEYVIPDGVLDINHAFNSRDKLTSVTIPGTVQSMRYAFESCPNLKTIRLGADLKAIDVYAFAKCDPESLELPETLDSFGFAAVAGCKNLVELTFPETAQSIGEFALGECDSLIRLTFLNPACEISKNVFLSPYTGKKSDYQGVIVGYDDSTAEAFAKENNYTFISLGKLSGYLYYKKYTDHIEIIGHTNKLPEKAEIPAKIEDLPVTVIRNEAFRDAAGLKEIKLPETLAAIGKEAFCGTGLTSLVIPDTVGLVDCGAFASCQKLETLTLGAKIVQAYSFRSCTALKSVTVTKSVQNMVSPFVECPALKELTVPDTECAIYHLLENCAALETVTIGAQQLGGTYDSSDYDICGNLPALKNLKLTESVKLIKGSFRALPLLDSLELPASVTAVECSLFDSGCTAMMTDGKLIIRNPACELNDRCLYDESDNKFGGTVYGYPASTAETYCKTHNIRFVPICKVSFDSGSETGVIESREVFGEVTFPELSVSAPEGKCFVGWQTEKYAQIYTPGSAAQLTKDTVFRAYYEPVVCTVKFEANGGTGAMAELTVDFGHSFILPLCDFTAPAGKQFLHWQIKGGNSAGYLPGAALSADTDLTFIPVWWDGKSILIGDVNMDGTVDTSDAMLLTRYVNAWEDITVNLKAADLNQDGEIDTEDAMILTRYVNGWEGYNSYIVIVS